MRPIMPLLLLWVALFGFQQAALAQSSASYRLEQSTFNNGGNPVPELTSTGYKMTLDAIGDPVAGYGLSGASYWEDSGFIPFFRPPGEVLNLRFLDPTTVSWNPEPSVGTYDLYWGLTASQPQNWGNTSCGLTAASATDPSDTPPSGQVYFYLVSANNNLNEEGTIGTTSGGVNRTNPGTCQ